MSKTQVTSVLAQLRRQASLQGEHKAHVRVRSREALRFPASPWQEGKGTKAETVGSTQ